jgi:hypothetical protein
MTEHIRKSLLEDTSDNRYTEQPVGEHRPRHGRPASWALVAVVIAAFCVGGVAVIEQWWPVIWACLGIVVLAVPAGKLIGIMNDTVAIEPLPRRRAALTGRDSAADPGVRLD